MSILGNTIIIRDLSFYQCVSLTNIILFGANISIGFQSFSACTGLSPDNDVNALTLIVVILPSIITLYKFPHEPNDN